MKIIKFLNKLLLVFTSSIIVFYLWFYFSAKKPNSVSYISSDLREVLQRNMGGLNCKEKELNKIDSIYVCRMNISFDLFNQQILKGTHFVNVGRSASIDYISDKILIISSLPNMFESFWSSLLLPSHVKIEIRKVEDLSLLYSFKILTSGKDFVPYKNQVYYLCGEDYVNVDNKDISTLPVSEFCVVDMGQSFE